MDQAYFCSKCYKNKYDIPYIFPIKAFVEGYNRKCRLCGGDIEELALTEDELLTILKISRDPDYILEMNKIKQNNPTEFTLSLLQSNQSSPQESQSKPKCPICGSTKIKKISTTKKWFSVGFLGLASPDIGKSLVCESCGYKW